MGCAGIIPLLLGLLALGYATKCPIETTSPGREILCYTSKWDAKLLENSICRCTTLVHQGHDLEDLVKTGLDDLRKSLKQLNPVIQFVISINDARGILKTSADARQKSIADIVAILTEVDGVELNVTAGSKERLVHFVKGLKNEMVRKSRERRVIMALPTKAEQLAKHFDIKELSKHIDLFSIPTHYLMDDKENYKTFHPSRLMGLFDLLNTDSLVDLVHGLGSVKRKILVSLPASGYKFTLKIKDQNTPSSPAEDKIPNLIDRAQLCNEISKGEWTIERDEDLTAPYAFQNESWIAFEDRISSKIKGKYVLLRDLAGLGIRDVDNDIDNDCGKSITENIYQSFTENKRKTREAVLTSLQNDIYNSPTSYPNNLKSSEYRISRVVDTEGNIHAMRENTQTEFSCPRQGYYVHPKSCNRFYRCVKFDQTVENYSVFEFDCPAGLAFDETTEVCVWPGSLPEGSPCPGSPEIAPSTPRRFKCPAAGYYADPQNCRWFFACMDLGAEKMLAYEFQCPYGLVFDENKLACEWPWLVPKCAGTGYEKDYGGGGGGIGGHGGFDYGQGGYDGKQGGGGGYNGFDYGHGGFDGKQGGGGGGDGHGGFDYGHGGFDGKQGGGGGDGHGGFDYGQGGYDSKQGGGGGDGHGGFDYGQGGHDSKQGGSGGGFDHGRGGHDDGKQEGGGGDGHGGFDYGQGGHDSKQGGGGGGFDHGQGGHDGGKQGGGGGDGHGGFNYGQGGHDNKPGGGGGHGGFDHGQGGHDDGKQGGGGDGHGGFDHDQGRYDGKQGGGEGGGDGHGGYDNKQGGDDGYGHETGGNDGDYDNKKGGDGDYDNKKGGDSDYDNKKGGDGDYDNKKGFDEDYDNKKGSDSDYDYKKEYDGDYDNNKGSNGDYDDKGHGYDDKQGGGEGGEHDGNKGKDDGKQDEHDVHDNKQDGHNGQDGYEYPTPDDGKKDDGQGSDDNYDKKLKPGEKDDHNQGGYDVTIPSGYDKPFVEMDKKHRGEDGDKGYEDKDQGQGHDTGVNYDYDRGNKGSEDDTKNYGYDYSTPGGSTKFGGHVTIGEHEGNTGEHDGGFGIHTTGAFTHGTSPFVRTDTGHSATLHNTFTPSIGVTSTNYGYTPAVSNVYTRYDGKSEIYPGTSPGIYVTPSIGIEGGITGGKPSLTTSYDYRGDSGKFTESSGHSLTTPHVTGGFTSGVTHPDYENSATGKTDGYSINVGTNSVYGKSTLPQGGIFGTTSGGISGHSTLPGTPQSEVHIGNNYYTNQAHGTSLGLTTKSQGGFGFGTVGFGRGEGEFAFGSSTISPETVFYTKQTHGTFGSTKKKIGGFGFGSTIGLSGDNYHTNDIGSSLPGSVKPKVGGFTPSLSVTASGNQLHNNEAGASLTGSFGAKEGFTPSLSVTAGGNEFYTNEAGPSLSGTISAKEGGFTPSLSVTGGGNEFLTNHAEASLSGSIPAEVGSFTPSLSVTGGNVYTNHAEASLSGSILGKEGGFTPSLSVTGSGNEYYTSHVSDDKYTTDILKATIPDSEILKTGAGAEIISPIRQPSDYRPSINIEFNKNSVTESSPKSPLFTPEKNKLVTGNQYHSNQAGIKTEEIPIASINDGYKTNEYHDNGGRGTIRYNNGVVTRKYTEDDLKDYRTSFTLLPAAEVSQTNTLAPLNSSIDVGVGGGVYTRGGFTKTGPTKTGITTAQIGGSGSYVAGGTSKRPAPRPDEIGENAFGTVSKATSGNVNSVSLGTLSGGNVGGGLYANDNSRPSVMPKGSVTPNYSYDINGNNVNVGAAGASTLVQGHPDSASPQFNIQIDNAAGITPLSPAKISQTPTGSPNINVGFSGHVFPQTSSSISPGLTGSLGHSGSALDIGIHNTRINAPASASISSNALNQQTHSISAGNTLSGNDISTRTSTKQSSSISSGYAYNKPMNQFNTPSTDAPSASLSHSESPFPSIQIYNTKDVSTDSPAEVNTYSYAKSTSSEYQETMYQSGKPSSTASPGDYFKLSSQKKYPSGLSTDRPAVNLSAGSYDNRNTNVFGGAARVPGISATGSLSKPATDANFRATLPTDRPTVGFTREPSYNGNTNRFSGGFGVPGISLTDSSSGPIAGVEFDAGLPTVGFTRQPSYKTNDFSGAARVPGVSATGSLSQPIAGTNFRASSPTEKPSVGFTREPSYNTNGFSGGVRVPGISLTDSSSRPITGIDFNAGLPTTSISGSLPHGNNDYDYKIYDNVGGLDSGKNEGSLNVQLGLEQSKGSQRPSIGGKITPSVNYQYGGKTDIVGNAGEVKDTDVVENAFARTDGNFGLKIDKGTAKVSIGKRPSVGIQTQTFRRPTTNLPSTQQSDNVPIEIGVSFKDTSLPTSDENGYTYPKPENKFISRPISVKPISSTLSPSTAASPEVNIGIYNNEVAKPPTSYDRGSVKYTPSDEYDDAKYSSGQSRTKTIDYITTQSPSLYDQDEPKPAGFEIDKNIKNIQHIDYDKFTTKDSPGLRTFSTTPSSSSFDRKGAQQIDYDKFTTKDSPGLRTFSTTPSSFDRKGAQQTDYDKFSSKESPGLRTGSISSTVSPRISSSRAQTRLSTYAPPVTTHSSNYRKSSTTPNYDVVTKSSEASMSKGKGKVIVKFSDLHPVLLGKLSAECTCKADPFASFRGNKPLLIDTDKGKVDLRNYDESEVYVDLDNNSGESTGTYENLETALDKSSTLSPSLSISTHNGSPVVGVRKSSQSQRPSSMYLPQRSTAQPPSSTYLPSSTVSSALRVSASDIEANTYSSRARSRSGKSLGSARSKNLSKDVAADRTDYGEIGVLELNPDGRAECARAGLFRHPKFCNKFYACHWDDWKKKFTLHIFNCPIHLTFDSNASACNWPSKGPACQDDNLLI